MKSNNPWRTGLAQILVGAAVLFALMAAREAKAGGEQEHLVTDWSSRHMVYSTPKTLKRQMELSGDRRYVDQLRRREWQRQHGDRDEWRWRHARENSGHIQGDWSEDMGPGATVGAGNYPAKFSFQTTSANCVTPAPQVGQQPDFVVYNTSLAGSTTQATIVAFTNLYSGCTGVRPQTYWAYNTGTTGAVVTSPVLSIDGSQVAFVQSTPGAATLVILRWAPFSGTLAHPIVPPAGPCTALTAPCATTITFSNQNSDANPTDTLASPIYDYQNDAVYVGDASGFLHKFTGIFFGTPAEVVCTSTTITAGCTAPAGTNFWPAIVDPFAALGSAVVIDSTNEVLLTDNQGVLAVVDMTIGGIDDLGTTTTVKLASTGFDDGPLVDMTTGTVYVFARADVAEGNVAAVFQFPVPAIADNLDNATGTELVVTDGVANPASAFYIGAFTDDYYTSGNGTGDLLVCSTSGGVNAVWDIPINGGAMSTPVAGPAMTTVNVGCSPITEFSADGATDTIFLSVAGSAVTAAPINCPTSATGGCIMSFDVTDLSTWGTTSVTTATAAETGGTSGIVIDNGSASPGASQVYFTPLADQVCPTSTGTGGCAIQASQSGLN